MVCKSFLIPFHRFYIFIIFMNTAVKLSVVYKNKNKNKIDALCFSYLGWRPGIEWRPGVLMYFFVPPLGAHSDE
jgi:hypothetical protein